MLTSSSALERLLRPSVGDMPVEYARRLLQMSFSPADQARHAELAEKSQLGTLTGEERQELDDLLTANDVLMILQAKAQLSLNQSSAA
jgi:hypothetical protein